MGGILESVRILLLGGTRWLGRTLAETALASGHRVTCVARGTQVAPGAMLVRADRDVDDASATWAARDWDAVIDVATGPGHVRRAVRDLAPHAARYLYVSSCNVYASLAADGIDEDAPLRDPLAADTMASPDDYGSAKAACEQAVLAGFGPDRTIVIRPGLIGGPGDPTGRSTYWPLRFARPSNPAGRVLVPDAPQQKAAVIDARDLASWAVGLLERGGHGIFNAAGESLPLAAHLDVARRVAGHTGPLVAMPGPLLDAQGVGQWMGPRSLPLWIDDPEARGLGALSTARARDAGLELRPLSETLADALAWAVRTDAPTVTGAGLDDAEESALLDVLDRP